MRVSVRWVVPLVFLGWTGLLSAQQPFLPGGIATVPSIQRVVPDTICFYNAPNYDGVEYAQLGNWEPYTSVLGDSTFLIESNTYAESVDPTNPIPTNQRYGVVFQPVGGPPGTQGEAFFGDNGIPYRLPINASRQNGNPGRVAGDKRPGAVNFITGGETSVDEYSAFQSDNRWNLGLIRDPGSRYATVQTYSLDLSSSTQTPTSKAFDAILGRQTSGEVSGEVGRFGGELTALSNGNFLVVVDDESNLIQPGRGATGVIVGPNGAIVLDSFAIGSGQIWSNVSAYNGGFCVRLNGILNFFDNSGNLQGQDPQTDAEVFDNQNNLLFAFQGDRGDGTRIASHINSNFVFMAGANNGGSIPQVRLAVWDARTQTVVSSINVNELAADNGGTDAVDFQPPVFDRVNLAVDALNRVLVTYTVQPQGFTTLQVVARVLAFDGTKGTFKYLTPSFFPLLNWDTTQGVAANPVASHNPSPSMTTTAMLIAVKGSPNSLNLPALGSDLPTDAPQGQSADGTNFYTVLTHPDPQPDPTPPVP
jgi:hypothetical protein